jgi:predicted Zn finger-like uncharacterized protein
MYVACPSCKALYAISPDQLRLAHGRVRCSQCRTTFSATHAVFADPHEALAFDYPPEEQLLREIDELVDRALDQVPGAAESPPQTGVAGGDSGQGMLQDDSYSEAARQPAREDEVLNPPASPTRGDDAVVEPVVPRTDADCYAQPIAGDFVSIAVAGEQPYELSHTLLFDDEPVRHGRTSWGAIAAALLLTAALVGQYAWWERNRLAQIATLRPALDWLCGPLNCNLPLRRDLGRVEMVEREVRDHPQVRDALLVSAAFVNRAPYTQSYPVLQISFSDVAGTPVAVRRFMPEEYLRDKNPAHGMAPGEEALVMLEVVDPGERAVSFQFDFM